MNRSGEVSETLTDARAEAFVKARLSGAALQTYPGTPPQNLDEAYAIQDMAIRAWPDALAGWKVGRILGETADRMGTDRLAGPIFTKQVHQATTAPLDMPVFAQGFAAVEGEVTAVIAKDVPAGKTSFSSEEALQYISALHLGVEIASSPFAEINDHGPHVTISDFGNNYGLILGEEIPDWRDMSLADWEFVTMINGSEVGRNTPAGIPGGPIESARFLLENTAQRGFPAKKGMMILTGAVTGVHQAYVGDSSEVSLPGLAPVSCRLVAG